MTKGLVRSMKAGFTLIVLGCLTAALPTTASADAPVSNSKEKGAEVAPSTAAKVDLNVATVAQLDALPRIGPAVAARVIAYREQNGGFRSIDELMNVRGIGQKTFDRLREQVMVGAANGKAEAESADADVPERAAK